ncbi:preprotein translocase subunit SecE [Candidatus Parcubacteria bacterium]|nr:MAG: preprotein translocase subunit SecE [Candidatus Parcubacteria bacterium]GIW69218.1 MAG: hypothetical protein KatS3mg100_712 [Candidatus Parcubacteria bacterium]
MFAYLRAVREELSHVSWPTPRETVVYTALVIAVSLATAVYLGLFDAILLWFIDRIVFF